MLIFEISLNTFYISIATSFLKCLHDARQESYSISEGGTGVYAFNPAKDAFHNSDQKKLTSIKLSTIGQVFVYVHVCACTLSHFSHADSLHDPMDCSLPVSSVYGILQARILEWVSMPSSRDRPNPRIRPTSPVAPALQTDSYC